MSIDLFPVFSYVIVSTFTPGPSNISSASSAVLHGYKNSLYYQSGLAVGVFLLMALSGWISTTLLGIFPALEPVLRFAGAAYILYLAFGILKTSYTFADQKGKALGFGHGFLLQVLNPKLIVYAFTLFSTFLAPIPKNPALVVLLAALLAATSFCATSIWAVFGSTIRTNLHNPRLKTLVNILLSLSLVYSALALIGIP
jgi:cysteine/O-acetylserine efflux protein